MIAKTIAQFADEIQGAMEYQECAADDPSTSQMYSQMAEQEIGHAEKLAEAIRNELGRRADDPELVSELSMAIDRMTASELAKVKEATR